MTAETLFNAGLKKPPGGELLKPQSLADKLAMVDWRAFEECVDALSPIPSEFMGIVAEQIFFNARIGKKPYASH